jgi:hypothetical protein
MKYQGEKVIEAKEGHTCVVEKTRDKYLKDECIRFLDLIDHNGCKLKELSSKQETAQ